MLLLESSSFQQALKSGHRGMKSLTFILAALLQFSHETVAEPIASEAARLLARFREINWDTRAVGTNKDLADEAWKVRIEVENGLIALGSKAVPALIEACSDATDANRHVNALAAYCVGYLNDRSAVQPLIRLVESSPDARVRLMAVEALGRLGDPAALVVVKNAAESDKSGHVKVAANWALPRVQKGEGIGDSLRSWAIANFDSRKIASAAVDKPAPDFALADGAGKTIRLSDFRGKKNVVLLFLLADW